jgi:hypothetical protein
MRGSRVVPFLVLLARAPVLVSAQELGSDVVGQINASSKARVRLIEGPRATLYSPKADSTSLEFKRGEFVNNAGSVVQLSQPLGVAQVAEIQVANGTHAWKGAKIGAGVVAALALLATAVSSSSEDNGYYSPSTGETVSGVVVFALIGGGIGALIGSTSTRWKPVYRGKQ